MSFPELRRTILKYHGHRGALVQDTELALGALLISRVGKDASVEQSSIGIRNHATDITRAIRLAIGLSLLERVEVLDSGLLPVERVTLVDRVDGAALGHLHAGVGKDKLANAVVEGEAVDGGALHGEHELRRGAVHGEASGEELRAGLEDVGLGALRALGQLVDGKDGADRDTSVEVG